MKELLAGVPGTRTASAPFAPVTEAEDVTSVKLPAAMKATMLAVMLRFNPVRPPVKLPPTKLTLDIAPLEVPKKPTFEKAGRLIVKPEIEKPLPLKFPLKPLPELKVPEMPSVPIGTKPRPPFQLAVPLASMLPAKAKLLVSRLLDAIPCKPYISDIR